MNLLMRSGQGASTISRTAPFYSGGMESVASFGIAKAGPQSRDWSDCINELLDIRNFDDDWDGGGTESLDPTLVDSAISLAFSFKEYGMPPADRVIAGVNRTLFLNGDHYWAFKSWKSRLRPMRNFDGSQRVRQNPTSPYSIRIALEPSEDPFPAIQAML